MYLSCPTAFGPRRRLPAGAFFALAPTLVGGSGVAFASPSFVLALVRRAPSRLPSGGVLLPFAFSGALPRGRTPHCRRSSDAAAWCYSDLRPELLLRRDELISINKCSRRMKRASCTAFVLPQQGPRRCLVALACYALVLRRMFMMIAGYKKCTLLAGTQSAPQGMRVMPTARSTSASERGHSPQVSDAGHVRDYVVLARLVLVFERAP